MQSRGFGFLLALRYQVLLRRSQGPRRSLYVECAAMIRRAAAGSSEANWLGVGEDQLFVLVTSFGQPIFDAVLLRVVVAFCLDLTRLSLTSQLVGQFTDIFISLHEVTSTCGKAFAQFL